MRAKLKPRFSPFDEPGDPYFSNVSMDRISGGEEGGSLHEMIPADTKMPEEIAEKNEAKERLMESIRAEERRIGKEDRWEVGREVEKRMEEKVGKVDEM